VSRAAGPLNAAVRAALLADPEFVACCGGPHVYSEDLPPDLRPLPEDWVILGADDSAAGGAAFGSPGEENGLTIHCWSTLLRADGIRLTGKLRVHRMAAYIARALTHQQLDLPGYGLVLAGRADLVTVLRDPFAPRMHAVLRYRATTRRTAGDAVV
jgi:hypothetical protein